MQSVASDTQNRVDGPTWLMLTDTELRPGSVYDWAVHPTCGAVVMFSGTVRDHAEGREDVKALTYEAYEAQVLPKMQAIVDEARSRWSDIVRVAVHHRTGRLELGASSVVVVVSSPHRPDAFEAARFLIDALKSSIPIWKREHWSEGDDWGTNAHDLVDVADIKVSK